MAPASLRQPHCGGVRTSLAVVVSLWLLLGVGAVHPPAGGSASAACSTIQSMPVTVDGHVHTFLLTCRDDAAAVASWVDGRFLLSHRHAKARMLLAQAAAKLIQAAGGPTPASVTPADRLIEAQTAALRMSRLHPLPTGGLTNQAIALTHMMAVSAVTGATVALPLACADHKSPGSLPLADFFDVDELVASARSEGATVVPWPPQPLDAAGAASRRELPPCPEVPRSFRSTAPGLLWALRSHTLLSVGPDPSAPCLPLSALVGPDGQLPGNDLELRPCACEMKVGQAWLVDWAPSPRMQRTLGRLLLSLRFAAPLRRLARAVVARLHHRLRDAAGVDADSPPEADAVDVAAATVATDGHATSGVPTAAAQAGFGALHARVEADWGERAASFFSDRLEARRLGSEHPSAVAADDGGIEADAADAEAAAAAATLAAVAARGRVPRLWYVASGERCNGSRLARVRAVAAAVGSGVVCLDDLLDSAEAGQWHGLAGVEMGARPTGYAKAAVDLMVAEAADVAACRAASSWCYRLLLARRWLGKGGSRAVTAPRFTDDGAVAEGQGVAARPTPLPGVAFAPFYDLEVDGRSFHTPGMEWPCMGLVCADGDVAAAVHADVHDGSRRSPRGMAMHTTPFWSRLVGPVAQALVERQRLAAAPEARAVTLDTTPGVTFWTEGWHLDATVDGDVRSDAAQPRHGRLPGAATTADGMELLAPLPELPRDTVRNRMHRANRTHHT